MLCKMFLKAIGIVIILLFPERSGHNLIGAEKAARVTLTSMNCALDDCIGCRSSITINGKEHSPQRDGLNVVVVDPTDMTVTSTYAFSKSMQTTFRDFVQLVKQNSLILVTSQLLCERSSTTDLIVQRSIVSGIRELDALNETLISPLVLRSFTMVLCKDSCKGNMTTSLKLPLKIIQRLDEDSAMVYFTVTYSETSVVPSEKMEDRAVNNRDLLLVTIGTCSALALMLVVTVSLLAVKCCRKYKHPRTKSSSIDRGSDCQLIYCSARSDGIARRREHPCRIGRGSVEQSTTFRLFSEYAGQEENLLPSSFASYIQVDQENRHPVLYKIPSGVAKYDPPQQAPPYSHHRRSTSRASSTDSYLKPHEYASPNQLEHFMRGETEPKLSRTSNRMDFTSNPRTLAHHDDADVLQAGCP